MQFRIFIPGLKEFIFQETDSGILNLVSKKSVEKDVPKDIIDKSILFNFKEIKKHVYLSMEGEPGYSITRSINYRFIVKAIKIITYIYSGVIYKAGVWINYDFVSDKSLLSLFAKMIGKERVEEIFFEYFLGQYELPKNKYINNNLTFIFGEWPDRFKEKAFTWYKNTKRFSTRIAGFRYRKKRFVKIVHDKEILSFKPGEEVLVIREHENNYDENAVAFILNNGEKLGYVPKNIAFHLAKLMDKGRIYRAKITAVLQDFRDDDERVYVELRWN